MFLMVFYDFKIRGVDLQGRSPRLSFLYVMLSSRILINIYCLSGYCIMETINQAA